jgi:MYXO-CTERM domain-containing protein
VTEDGPSFGQIPASFPVIAESDLFSHAWNITWVRDQAYSAVALARAGKLDEAAAALAFTLQDKAGGYVEQVGMDYGLSVCRLYGDGTEWSDDNGSGPNIELDNFGLTLWAIGEYVDAGGDPAFVADYDVLAAVADPLLNAIDDLDLIQADSSIWERHWNGNQKHFTYTTAMAIKGLDAIAELSGSADYSDGARRLEVGLCENLVDTDLGLLGNAEEEPQNAIDLAAVEAFNHGILDAQGPTATSTFATWEDRLAVANGMGFKRNDDGDIYDEQEWVVMDLRLAEAYRRGCQLDKAKAIEGWITRQAYLNLWSIPELMDPDTGRYVGPTPMLGFGAGAYMVGLYNREAAALDCSTGIEQTCASILGTDTSDDTGTAGGGGGSGSGGDGSGDGSDEAADEAGDDDKGCGCATASAPNIWLAIPLIGLALLRRRRFNA